MQFTQAQISRFQKFGFTEDKLIEAKSFGFSGIMLLTLILYFGKIAIFVLEFILGRMRQDGVTSVGELSASKEAVYGDMNAQEYVNLLKEQQQQAGQAIGG